MTEGPSIRIMSSAQMGKCPKLSMLPQHFRDDGTCNCQHRDEIDAQLKELNIERKRLRAEHKKIVKEIDELKRTR